MNIKTDIIVIAINQRFFAFAKALINSITLNWPNSPQILAYIHPDVEPSSIDQLKRIKKVIIKRYDPKILSYYKYIKPGNGIFKSMEFIETGYFTLHLFSDAFDDFNNLLFLDADTLVLQPLDGIFNNTELFICNGLNERLLPYLNIEGNIKVKPFLYTFWLVKLFCDGIVPTFNFSGNSGVLMIPKSYRSKENELTILSLLKKYNSITNGDQDIILLFMLKRKLKVSNMFDFNFQLRFFNLIKKYPNKCENLMQKANEIKVIHFNGPKPATESFRNHSWTLGQKFWEDKFLYYRDALDPKFGEKNS